MCIIDIEYDWEIEGACVAEFLARVHFTYTPGSDAYFDKAFGNYLPGDDPEIEVENVELIEQGWNIKRPKVVPCPDFLADLIAAYVVEKHAPAMIDTAMEDAYYRQNGDE